MNLVTGPDLIHLFRLLNKKQLNHLIILLLNPLLVRRTSLTGTHKHKDLCNLAGNQLQILLVTLACSEQKPRLVNLPRNLEVDHQFKFQHNPVLNRLLGLTPVLCFGLAYSPVFNHFLSLLSSENHFRRFSRECSRRSSHLVSQLINPLHNRRRFHRPSQASGLRRSLPRSHLMNQLYYSGLTHHPNRIRTQARRVLTV